MSGAGGPLVPATSLSNRPPKQPWHRTDHPGALGRSCQPLPLHNRAGRPVSVPYSQAAKASGGRPKPQLQQGHSAEGAAARQSPPPPPPTPTQTPFQELHTHCSGRGGGDHHQESCNQPTAPKQLSPPILRPFV